jgi:hypothetical protein
MPGPATFARRLAVEHLHGGDPRVSGESNSRARMGSHVTTFMSVSLKNECSLRLADPTVSQASSTIPILACTYSGLVSPPLRATIVVASRRAAPLSAAEHPQPTALGRPADPTGRSGQPAAAGDDDARGSPPQGPYPPTHRRARPSLLPSTDPTRRTTPGPPRTLRPRRARRRARRSRM